MMSRRIQVRHLESGKIFSSIKDAAQFFGIDTRYVDGRREFKEGLTFEQLSEIDYSMLRIPQTDSPEEFRSIPGYEGLYSISNKGTVRSDKFPGRIKKVYVNKSKQHIVILSKNSSPHCFTVESLYKLTWLSKPISKFPFHSNRGKPIKCIEDDKLFPSIKECCVYYKIDYAKFLKASKSAKNDTIKCKGHTFIKFSSSN